MTPAKLKAKIPGFWANETSGRLAPAVRAYLEGRQLSRAGVMVIRAYLRQWIAGDFQDFPGGEDLEALRRGVDYIGTTRDIDEWLKKALELAIDPF